MTRITLWLSVFVLPGLLLLLILSIPFIGRFKAGYWINASVVTFLLVYIGLLSAASWGHDLGDAEFGAAVAGGARDAERVKQLASSPQGIPVNGALWLLRNDAKTQGPKIYEKQCAVCHAYSGSQEEAAGEYQGRAKVGKVDVDTNPKLSERYGIRAIPTLLFFKGGEVVDRIIGMPGGAKAITDKLEGLL